MIELQGISFGGDGCASTEVGVKYWNFRMLLPFPPSPHDSNFPTLPVQYSFFPIFHHSYLRRAAHSD
jgi:hypothetical protein